jgi:hypothetical protein
MRGAVANQDENGRKYALSKIKAAMTAGSRSIFLLSPTLGFEHV